MGAPALPGLLPITRNLLFLLSCTRRLVARLASFTHPRFGSTAALLPLQGELGVSESLHLCARPFPGPEHLGLLADQLAGQHPVDPHLDH